MPELMYPAATPVQSQQRCPGALLHVFVPFREQQYGRWSLGNWLRMETRMRYTTCQVQRNASHDHAGPANAFSTRRRHLHTFFSAHLCAEDSPL
jgi:hypothetical protein